MFGCLGYFNSLPFRQRPLGLSPRSRRPHPKSQPQLPRGRPLSSKKQKLDDPAYEVVQWALANQQYVFQFFFPGCDATKLEHEMQYPV